MFHPVLFVTLMLYERLVNATDLLAGLGANLFGVIRKADRGDLGTQ